jgi:hypothetical protein
VEFLREAQNYYADDKGRFSDPDDCIDSARYALLGCLNGWSEEYDGRSPSQRFRDVAHNIRIQKAQQRANASNNTWKRVYSPNE